MTWMVTDLSTCFMLFVILTKYDTNNDNKRHGLNFSLSSIVMAGVTIAATTTTSIPTTSLITTTPPPECPYPYEVNVYQYSNRDYFTLHYPVDGYQVLKGSGDVLALPPDRPQQIVLVTENVGFHELTFSVRHARAAALLLTLFNGRLTAVRHLAAVDVVSCRKLS